MRTRTRLPRSIADQIPHQILAWAPLVGDQWLVVCDQACVIATASGIVREVRWTDVENAAWDGDARRLTLNGIDGSRVEVTTASDDVASATAAVRRQVTSSIVHVQILPTRGGDVRALIRRTADGGLISQLIARGPVAGDEQAAVDELERQARAAVGLTTP